MPQDISKLSDAELEAIVNKSKDISKMSDSDLQSIAGSTPPVLDVQHPDISFKERAVVKNFASSPESAVAYLKQQHPEMDVQAKNGNILLKKAGEAAYKVLDPSGFDLQDITDIGYDVASGIGQAAATAGGGLAGFFGGAGVGAVPAAMAAGATASAASEAAKQGVGKALGIPDNMSLGEIGLAAGIGGALPGLGAAGKGIYQAATRTLAPKAAGMLTGVMPDTIKTFAKKYPQILKMEQEGTVGEFVDNSIEKLTKTIGGAKQETGTAIADAINTAGKNVDISKAKQPLQNLLKEVESTSAELNNPETARLLSEIKSSYNNLFTKVPQEVDKKVAALVDAKGNQLIPNATKEEIANEISPSAAFKLQDQLKDLADLSRLGQTNIKSRFANGATTGDKRISEAAREAYNALNTQFEEVTGGISSKLKSEYKDLIDVQKKLAPYFKTQESAYSTFRNLDKPSKKLLYEELAKFDKRFGTNLIPDAKLLEAHTIFGKPSLTPISSGGATSTSRSILGATALGSLGSLAGYQSGAGYAGAAAGGLLGSSLGSAIFSPAMLRRAILAGVKGEQAIKSVAPSAPTLYGAGKSAWEMLRNRDQQPTGEYYGP